MAVNAFAKNLPRIAPKKIACCPQVGVSCGTPKCPINLKWGKRLEAARVPQSQTPRTNLPNVSTGVSSNIPALRHAALQDFALPDFALEDPRRGGPGSDNSVVAPPIMFRKIANPFNFFQITQQPFIQSSSIDTYIITLKSRLSKCDQFNPDSFDHHFQNIKTLDTLISKLHDYIDSAESIDDEISQIITTDIRQLEWAIKHIRTLQDKTIILTHPNLDSHSQNYIYHRLNEDNINIIIDFLFNDGRISLIHLKGLLLEVNFLNLFEDDSKTPFLDTINQLEIDVSSASELKTCIYMQHHGFSNEQVQSHFSLNTKNTKRLIAVLQAKIRSVTCKDSIDKLQIYINKIKQANKITKSQIDELKESSSI